MASFKQKLENYWYHYKWQTIIGTVSLILMTLLVVQCATTSSSSLQVMYTGPEQIDVESRDAVETALTYLWRTKHKEDQEGVSLASIFLMSKEQLEENGKLENTGGDPTVIASLMATERQKFFSFVGTGECLIYLLDPAWYQELKAGGRLASWEASLGYRPQNAADDYGVRFHDTEFAGAFKCFENLPQDTMLCVLRLPDMNFFAGKREKERYDLQLELFRAMIEFSL